MYAPEPVPLDVNALPAYLMREMLKLQVELEATRAGSLRVYSVVPQRPREGMLVAADGTNWNPGSGAGAYLYMSGTWRFLG